MQWFALADFLGSGSAFELVTLGSLRGFFPMRSSPHTHTLRVCESKIRGPVVLPFRPVLVADWRDTPRGYTAPLYGSARR